MSYSLIYDKQFVKLTDKLFIPMILAGDNNLYDHNNRRARSWSNFSHVTRGAVAGSFEQMIEVMQEERQRQIDNYKDSDREYKDSSFGGWSGLRINGSLATFGTYTGVAKTGCKKALTIEQLKEENISINIHTYRYGDNDEQLKEQGLEPVSFTPKSTEEMLNFIKDVEPKYAGKKGGALYIDYSGMYENTPKWIRKKCFPKVKVERQEIESTLGYAVKITGKDGVLGYFVKGGRSFRYSHSKTGGKQFIDKKDAERCAKKQDKNRSDFQHSVVQVEYSYPKTFYVPKGKKVTLPVKDKEKRMTDKQLIASLVLRAEGEEVANVFDPNQKCYLDPLGVALHDYIKGCEALSYYDKLEQGIKVFREKYPEEYMTLLD